MAKSSSKKRTGTGSRPPSHEASAKSHRLENAWRTNRLVSGARLRSISSIVTNSTRRSRPRTQKSICSGFLNDASAPSNVSGIRFAAMMPIMLECIFSARTVLLARRKSETA